MDNLISGVVTDHFSEIQDHYIDDYGLGNATHVVKWNRQFIQLILNYTNEVWLYRCSVLHGKDNLQRDTHIRHQVVELLMRLRRDPYQLPHGSRDLVSRSRSKIMNSELTSILNWISLVSITLDVQSTI